MQQLGVPWQKLFEVGPEDPGLVPESPPQIKTETPGRFAAPKGAFQIIDPNAPNPWSHISLPSNAHDPNAEATTWQNYLRRYGIKKYGAYEKTEPRGGAAMLVPLTTPYFVRMVIQRLESLSTRARISTGPIQSQAKALAAEVQAAYWKTMTDSGVYPFTADFLKFEKLWVIPFPLAQRFWSLFFQWATTIESVKLIDPFFVRMGEAWWEVIVEYWQKGKDFVEGASKTLLYAVYGIAGILALSTVHRIVSDRRKTG